MSQAFAKPLPALDPALLADVVRQDQRDLHFEIAEWSIQPLSSKGIINPDGLFGVRGRGRAGDGSARAWSVVLKVLKDSGQAQPLSSLWFWRREALAAKSGVLSALPGAICAPRFYGVAEQAGSDWLWMEYVEDDISNWQLDHYAEAAQALGRQHAFYLTGTPLPSAEWLCRGHARTWAEGLSPQNAWDDPIVQQHFSRDLQARVLQMWQGRDRFYAALDQLPQVFSHFDFQRRNLFAQHKEGNVTFAAVDWAQCGIGPVGGDLCALIGSSAVLMEWPASRLDVLEAAACDAYVRGLRAGGWQGDAALARLGYTAWTALHWGMAMPAAAAFWFSAQMQPRAVRQFGRPVDDLARTWAALCDFSLRRGDEARRLMADM